MPDAVTDPWALCEPCRRWYACPQAVGPPRCPVCLSQPTSIVDRVARDSVEHRG